MLNEWTYEIKKSCRRFFDDYGKVTIVGVILVASLVSVSLLVPYITPKKLQVSFLDVGQGDAIFIQTPHGHQMLIDGGVSDKVLEKISRHMNYFDRTIDVVVATHPDADHITGLIPILKKYNVTRVITSPHLGDTGVSEVLAKSILDENAEVHIAQKGDVINFGDGVVAHILYPTKNVLLKSIDTNDASVALVISYGGQTVLLTGDLSTTYEDRLIGDSLPQDVTIYKAGHHGSKYSSGDQLLSYIKPEYAIVSAGKDNKYNHPDSEALERLTTYSEEILSTIDKGTITFILGGKSVGIKTEK